LDLSPPLSAELDKGILILDKLIKDHGPVLVHCALGLSRSVTFVIGWLLYSKTVNSVDEALTLLKEKKYPVNLSVKHLILLTNWQKRISTTQQPLNDN
jgi:protein-tyrosine phosphatase